MSWYAGKAEIREYLQELNKDKKVSKTAELQEIFFFFWKKKPPLDRIANNSVIGSRVHAISTRNVRELLHLPL
jgi:hypothetical protein